MRKIKTCLNEYLGVNIISNELVEIENKIKYNRGIKFAVGKKVFDSTNNHTKNVFLVVRAGKYKVSGKSYNKKDYLTTQSESIISCMQD